MFALPIRTAFLQPRRRAAAMVEFAVISPLFFAITLGTVEICRMIYLRQSIKITAYECGRLAITPGVTPEHLQTQADLLLSGRRLHGYSLTVDPPDPSTLQFGDLATVSVSIDIAANSLMGNWFIRDPVLTESVTLMGEY